MKLTIGQKSADWVAKIVGSWRFIVIQSTILAAWVIYNSLVKSFDPPPFIGLNLLLSFQAAFTAPIIMMSQNRHSAKDSARMAQDLKVDMDTNRKIDEVIKLLQK